MIQNRHKRIKHMNSFINAKRQRKLGKFSENLLSRSQVSGFESWVPSLGFRDPAMNCVPGLRARVSSLESQVSGFGPTHNMCPGSRASVPTIVLGLGSNFSDMLYFMQCE